MFSLLWTILLTFLSLVSGQTSDPRNFTDLWLPGYHFVPYPFNWLNDPNGPFYDPVHGYYHMFYQYETPRTWGHAASPNLVDWIQLPIALNRAEWYDANGDYSGSATVLNDENRTVVLTVSTPEGHIFTATPVNRSDPFLKQWAYTDDTNCNGTSEPLFTPDYLCRDPTEMLSLAQGGYQMFVGSENGTELWQVDSDDGVFSATDWYNVGLAQENLYAPGGFWECPDVFKLSSGDEAVWVNKFSHNGDHFYTGEYDEITGIFTPGDWDVYQPQMYDQNDLFYASKSFYDPIGYGATEEFPRRVLFGWLIMTSSTPSGWTETWSNALSVPRTISISKNSLGASLTTYPIPELANLHNELLLEDVSFQLEVDALNGGASQLFEGVSGVMLDMNATITMSQDTSGADLTCGFMFFVSMNDATNHLRIPIPYLLAAGNGFTPTNYTFVRNVRILVDASIIEVYLDDGDTSLGGTTTYFFYPASSDYSRFGIYMENEMASLTMKPQQEEENTSSCSFDVHSVYSMNPFKFDASLYV